MPTEQKTLTLHCMCIAGHTVFQHLQTILLRDNQLSSWGDVDSLNQLASLTDLRLSGNPILNDARGGGRYEVSISCMHAFIHAVTQSLGHSVGHSVSQSIRLFVRPSINPTIHPFIRPSIHPSVYACMHACTHPSIHPC